MAFILADRVQETATANTTVSFTLSGAMTSYQSFAAIGNTNTTYYGATDGTNWEVGFGTYSTTGPTLTRDTILSSSNSGSAVTFSGTVTVWCDYPAGKQISSDYPNALGVVAPSTVNATTITGQTGQLNGTGQNLLFRSQLIGGTDWLSVGGATASTNSVVAPDSTTTASTLTVASGGYYRQITIASNRILSGVTYTYSCYVKASASGGASNVRLTTNNVSAWNTGFSTRFAITSSWQRVSVTGTITGTEAYFIIGAIDATGTNDATCAGNVDVWGAQFELGSVANTYIATVGSVVYGTPTLSFSGVSSIGLLSNGALYLQPAGTGALQAQATTSTTAGGNARGANAVDWQTGRAAAARVASASFGVVGGGYNNSATAFNATTAGGESNQASGNYAFIGGGASHTSSGTLSFVGGGSTNSSTGFYNFIGGGFTNSGTANAAVTTQATTAVTSGSTAVTLSATNASIRVGQYITGTGIASDTYVSAISTTSLTLSKNATATGTPTLSFFTPHGVVVGGGNNQATGSYSFIGGGGDAGTAANRNVASGDWSFVGGGLTNTASGIYSSVAGGRLSTASAQDSHALGSSCTASSTAAISIGFGNTSNGVSSAVLGASRGNARSIAGNTVFAASNSPIASSTGITQSAILVLGRETTDATPTVLASNTSAAGTTNQVILPNNSAYYFKGSIVANVTGAANGAAWSFEGAIMRGANAASTVLIDTPSVNRVGASAGAIAWSVALTADTTNGGLSVTVTGVAATTIRWVAKCETTEVTF